MKPSFHHRLINGQFEDPCLYVRLMWERRALLFDAGTLTNLGAGEIQKITDIFITHTHIDHFIGFDVILRAILRRQRPLSVYGPRNIAECIEGKLKGYTWNLIKEYPLKLEVFGIDEHTIRHTSFYAEEAFQRTERETVKFEGYALIEPAFKVRAVNLRHDIQCLGYSLEEEIHINIDKAALTGMGLPVGPWLSELKKAIRGGIHDDEELTADGKKISLGEAKKLATITKGQKITYVVDAAPDESNTQAIISLSKGSDTLYCEAYFLDEDRERAIERNHLTAKTAGRIAREAGVKNLAVMHFSPKYRNFPCTPEKEAMEEFLR